MKSKTRESGSKRKLPDPTPFAAQLYRATYGEPWPKGWRVRWVFNDRIAIDHYLAAETLFPSKTIRVNYQAALLESRADEHLRGRDWREFFKTHPEPWMFGGVWEILLHEFTHVRNRRLQHGAKFRRLLDDARRRLTGCELLTTQPASLSLTRPAA